MLIHCSCQRSQSVKAGKKGGFLRSICNKWSRTTHSHALLFFAPASSRYETLVGKHRMQKNDHIFALFFSYCCFSLILSPFETSSFRYITYFIFTTECFYFHSTYHQIRVYQFWLGLRFCCYWRERSHLFVSPVMSSFHWSIFCFFVWLISERSFFNVDLWRCCSRTFLQMSSSTFCKKLIFFI